MSSDLDTLSTIFSSRQGIDRSFLQSILLAHSGDVNRACHYLSSLSDADLDDLASTTHNNYHFPSSPSQHPQQLSNVDLAATISALKDIAIPTLQSHLQNLSLPPLCAETERIKYSLDDLCLTTFQIPPSQVSVTHNDSEIRIHAQDITLRVDVARWTYRLRFPPLSDQGRAYLSLVGVKVDIILSIQDMNLILTDCHCQITGPIVLRAHQARLTWLYNSLTPLLRTACRPSLQSALTQAIRQAVEEQLTDWTHWLS